MRDLDDLFTALARSRFRSRFRLGEREAAYLEQKGLDVILEHAEQFLRQRLGAAHPPNDGRQTPFRGHPVFIAQHATGTCCRKCLAKWHRIPRASALSEPQIEYAVRVIRRWLETAQR